METIKSYTDLKQSKKLAEILPLESADMVYFYWINHRTKKEGVDEIPTIRGELLIDNCDTPCWSLAALLSVITKQGLADLRFLQSIFDNRGNHLTNVWCCTFEDIGTVTLDLYANNPIDACCNMIINLHELKMQ